MTTALLTGLQARTQTQNSPLADDIEKRMDIYVQGHTEKGFKYVYIHLDVRTHQANQLAAKRLRKRGFYVHMKEERHGEEIYLIWWGRLASYLWYRLRMAYYAFLRSF